MIGKECIENSLEYSDDVDDEIITNVFERAYEADFSGNEIVLDEKYKENVTLLLEMRFNDIEREWNGVSTSTVLLNGLNVTTLHDGDKLQEID